MAFKKLKNGDVFELPTKKGMAYIQCVKETPVTESEIVRILPGTFSNEEVNIEQLVMQKETFFIQFPLKYGIKKNVIKLIGNYVIPQDVIVPRYFRDTHIVRGEFVCWHIVDSETLSRESVKELTDEQKKLSPWGFWNDSLLAERIAQGWTLDKWIQVKYGHTVFADVVLLFSLTRKHTYPKAFEKTLGKLTAKVSSIVTNRWRDK